MLTEYSLHGWRHNSSVKSLNQPAPRVLSPWLIVSTYSAQVVFVTDRSYRQGQELCTSYGDMDNAKRLFSFGFVTLTQPARSPHSSPVDTLPLPTEAFCDVSLALASSDALRFFKEGVLHEHARAGDGASSLMTAVFPMTPDRPFVWQLVEGPAQSFVEAVMPVLRLLTLTVEDFAGLEAFRGSCEPHRGDLAPGGLDGGCEPGVGDHQADSFPVLAAGKGSRVLERLGDRLSLENEREALRLLREHCSSRFRAIHLTSRDVEALREAAKKSNEAETFVASAPRSLLCSTVRVGEAMAWYALLEVCISRAEGVACRQSGQTWSSWVFDSCTSRE